MHRALRAMIHRATHLRTCASLVLRADAAAFYTLLEEEVTPDTADDFGSVDTPLWRNLGYWKESRTYPAACAEMATLLGAAAALAPEDDVLDVGFGFGDQDVHWIDVFAVQIGRAHV